MPWNKEGDNIDLFPELFLWERGCVIQRGDQQTLTTPKGRTTEIKMWGSLPYILKDELQKVIDDLPDTDVPGRTGAQPQTPTAARACRNQVPMSETRAHLKHLAELMPKDQLNNVCSKYRNLPDAYYGGDSSLFVTPDKFVLSDDIATASLRKLWEWYSGSSSLSSWLKQHEVSHFPPIDYRYGWNLAKKEHQRILLNCLLTQGVDCLFASPNCSPWGNNSRASSEEYREKKRSEETVTLTFLAIACFFQVLLERKYLVENSGYSDIFLKSPLRFLRLLPYFLALLDQCTCGGTLEGEFIRKRSHFQGSHSLHHLQNLCKGGHKHLNLRGHGRTAAAAMYPDQECEWIMLDAKVPTSVSEGGRILTAKMSWDEKIQTLQSIAKDNQRPDSDMG